MAIQTINYSTGDSSATANGAGITIDGANASITWDTLLAYPRSLRIYLNSSALKVLQEQLMV